MNIQLIALLMLFIFTGWMIWQTNKKKAPLAEFPPSYRKILEEKVAFYQGLNGADKLIFEKKMLQFLADTTITGIEVTVDEEDKVFVAASAIIPIFGFKNWKYTNLREVLLYPDSFSEDFELQEGKERPVLGMVGSGALQQVMVLSKHALRLGFLNKTDKNNTAIHEFVHLIDKTDGAVDGIPENLLTKQYTLPWITMMHKKLQEIKAGRTDINPYGATNQAEFLAVVAEYFFERPDLLQSKHPELYSLLDKMFCPPDSVKE